jgi:hypothetical protein
MLTVTDSAKTELTKLLGSATAQNKQLIIYFQGYG